MPSHPAFPSPSSFPTPTAPSKPHRRIVLRLKVSINLEANTSVDTFLRLRLPLSSSLGPVAVASVSGQHLAENNNCQTHATAALLLRPYTASGRQSPYGAAAYSLLLFAIGCNDSNGIPGEVDVHHRIEGSIHIGTPTAPAAAAAALLHLILFLRAADDVGVGVHDKAARSKVETA